MALKFRTRLNLTISALVFLIVTAMTVVTLLSITIWRRRKGRVSSAPTPTMEKAFQRMASEAATATGLRICICSKRCAGTRKSAASAAKTAAGASQRTGLAACAKPSATSAATALATSMLFGPPNHARAGITATAPSAEEPRSAA